MTEIITGLRELPKLAADYIRQHGWVQDREQEEQGQVCLTGAHAARALVTRDLIGTDSYTQAHYDALTAPWVSVFGPLHADDMGGSR